MTHTNRFDIFKWHLNAEVENGSKIRQSGFQVLTKLEKKSRFFVSMQLKHGKFWKDTIFDTCVVPPEGIRGL